MSRGLAMKPSDRSACRFVLTARLMPWTAGRHSTEVQTQAPVSRWNLSPDREPRTIRYAPTGCCRPWPRAAYANRRGDPHIRVVVVERRLRAIEQTLDNGRCVGAIAARRSDSELIFTHAPYHITAHPGMASYERLHSRLSGRQN